MYLGRAGCALPLGRTGQWVRVVEGRLAALPLTGLEVERSLFKTDATYDNTFQAQEEFKCKTARLETKMHEKK